MTKRIVGYANDISVQPGDRLDMMVSCFDVEKYDVEIVRLIHGDLNPEGPGFKSEVVQAIDKSTHPGRQQHVYSGSYGLVRIAESLGSFDSLTLQATVWPTTPMAGEQVILGWVSADGGCSCELIIDEDGCLAGTFTSEGRTQRLSSGVPLLERYWYVAAVTYDGDTKEAWVSPVPARTSRRIGPSNIHEEVQRRSQDS